MTATDLPLRPVEESVGAQARPSTFARIAKYTLVKAAVMALTVVVAVWVTIFIANLGGYVDVIIESRIDQMLMAVSLGGGLRDMPTEQKFEVLDEMKVAMVEAEGLNEPFLIRTFRWLEDGLTLDWGESRYARTRAWGRSSSDVKTLIIESLPRTLLVFGAANVALFFTSLFLSLGLSRRRGGWLDRLVITLSPMGAVPAWAFGIVLNIVFLRLQVGLTTAGTFDAWPREFTFAYIPMVLKYMFLPFLSIFVSGFFFSVYTWRSLFLIYSQEDYVDMAKAKGLPHRMLERRHILRPGLPAVLTSFALMLVVMWQEIIALEKFFNVAGIGRLFYGAIRTIDMPLMLGLIVSFAYLLAITMFLLDIVYAIVDPRVRVTSEGRTLRATGVSRRQSLLHRFRKSTGGLKTPARTEGRPLGSVSARGPSISERMRSLGAGLARWLRNSARSMGRTLKDIAQYLSLIHI